MLLLTQIEVAQRLRCTVQKVAKLRKTGQLAYIPGRPVLIEESDLRDYICKSKKEAQSITSITIAQRKSTTGKQAFLHSLTKRRWKGQSSI